MQISALYLSTIKMSHHSVQNKKVTSFAKACLVCEPCRAVPCHGGPCRVERWFDYGLHSIWTLFTLVNRNKSPLAGSKRVIEVQSLCTFFTVFWFNFRWRHGVMNIHVLNVVWNVSLISSLIERLCTSKPYFCMCCNALQEL